MAIFLPYQVGVALTPAEHWCRSKNDAGRNESPNEKSISPGFKIEYINLVYIDFKEGLLFRIGRPLFIFAQGK